MANLSTSGYFPLFTTLSILLLLLETSSAEPNSIFDFKNFKDRSNYEPVLALCGDAMVVNGGSSIEITGSSISSSGRVFYKEPVKLVEGNPRQMLSFSTCFTFSMSPENGDGLAFVVVPVRFPLNLFDGGSFGLLTANKFRTLVVEFDTSMDDKYGDLNGNHVGVDLNNFVSVKVSNVSSINLVINSGNKLHSCIDYEAGLRRLEVRLSKLGDTRPVSPLLSCPIDLSHVWKEEEILIGLSSSNGNSSQSCNLYSWSFQQRILPQWMHSEPLDPNAILEKKKSLEVPKKSDCLLKVLAALVFGTACGALGGVIVLFVWIILGNNRPVAPEEYPPKVMEFEYEKFKVVTDKPSESTK